MRAGGALEVRLELGFRGLVARFEDGDSRAPFVDGEQQGVLGFEQFLLLVGELLGDARVGRAVFDLRAQKVFRFGSKTLRGIFDVYNIFNGNSVQSQTVSYGGNYLRPIVISGPRTARFGARFEF